MRLVVPPVVQVIIAAGAIWALDKQLPDLHFQFSYQQHITVLFGLAGLVVAGIALGGFSRNKTTVNPTAPSQASTLVTGGIYRISRNPMYLGMLLLLIAWSIWIGNFSAIGVLAAFVAYMTMFQIKPEEEALLEIFGDEYHAYCKKTRRWF